MGRPKKHSDDENLLIVQAALERLSPRGLILREVSYKEVYDEIVRYYAAIGEECRIRYSDVLKKEAKTAIKQHNDRVIGYSQFDMQILKQFETKIKSAASFSDYVMKYKDILVAWKAREEDILKLIISIVKDQSIIQQLTNEIELLCTEKGDEGRKKVIEEKDMRISSLERQLASERQRRQELEDQLDKVWFDAIIGVEQFEYSLCMGADVESEQAAKMSYIEEYKQKSAKDIEERRRARRAKEKTTT